MYGASYMPFYHHQGVSGYSYLYPQSWDNTGSSDCNLLDWDLRDDTSPHERILAKLSELAELITGKDHARILYLIKSLGALIEYE